MVSYNSMKDQLEAHISSWANGSDITSEEIKRKLIRDWNFDVYDHGRVSQIQTAEHQRGENDG